MMTNLKGQKLQLMQAYLECWDIHEAGRNLQLSPKTFTKLVDDEFIETINEYVSINNKVVNATVTREMVLAFAMNGYETSPDPKMKIGYLNIARQLLTDTRENNREVVDKLISAISH